ncbi:MAG: hypothetical protein R2838_00995 [Caldilineaceae bacterium]
MRGLDEQMHTSWPAPSPRAWSTNGTASAPRHPTLCSLPEESADFRAILAVRLSTNWTKLAALVDVYMDATVRADLGAAVTSGLFETLLDLPASYTILAVTGAPETAVAWARWQGPRLAEVVNTGLTNWWRPAR